MSTRGLQMMLALTVTDPRRQAALLHGAPAAYAGFDLSEPERLALQAIRVDALVDYAYHAHQLFYGEDLRPLAGGQAARAVSGEPYAENPGGRRQCDQSEPAAAVARPPGL